MSRFPRLFGASGKGEPDYRAEYLRLLRMQEILKAITSERSLRAVLSRIMDAIVDLTGAERGFLILRREGGQQEIATARNIDGEEIRRPDFKISHSIAEKVISTGEAVVARNALLETPTSVYSSVAMLRLKSVLCVPFRLRDQVVGALYIDHRFEEGKFDSANLTAIEAFADQATIAIENARLDEENERSRRALETLNEELRVRIRATEDELAEARKDRADDPAREPTPLRHDFSSIVGKSSALHRVLDVLDRVTDTTIPVLVLGESGTGKELVARVLHANGPRRGGPFVAENCSAIPESLMESELFGATKGAFTGADRDRAGVFEQAHRGTLFLDEIGELRLDLQGKLLRVLQESEIRRVGGSERVKIDIRLVAASNRDIEAEVRAGRFREDLYYRLKGVLVTLPPLRDRRGDVPLLVAHALETIARERKESPREIAPEIVRRLDRFDWPGNVRQLVNEVRRLVALSPGRVEDPELLRELVPRDSLAARPRDAAERGGEAWWSGRTLEDVEREMIARVLEVSGGRKGDAAKRLGLPRRTLFDKLKRYGLE